MQYLCTRLPSMENRQPSTMLSMDSSASSSHEELDLDMNGKVDHLCPPDINLPLSAAEHGLPQPWSLDHCDMLDVGLVPHNREVESFLTVPKTGSKLAKRADSIWGAWFFFSFYFKPALNEKAKAKIVRDGNGVSGFDKSDLKLDVFMVQHDLENVYMWVFKERPENALGKMQLRSYMNGHSRQGDRPFPFSVDKGFIRSHRMQRKQYRGLSNPQCIHGIEFVPSPDLMGLKEEDLKRWVKLTGREVNFKVPPEASDFTSWRTLPNTEFEILRPRPIKTSHSPDPKKLFNGSVLNLSTQPNSNTNCDGMDLSPVSVKKRKENFPHSNGNCGMALSPPSDNGTDMELHPPEPHWEQEFSGVMKHVYGPVTAAKSIYEDEEGYLIIISLPFVDLERVKVSWRNTVTYGIIKLSCLSTTGQPLISRHNRTFKLADPHTEQCPPGEFVREIRLPTRIPEDAKLEAYYDGSVLEVLVPKLCSGVEEHEIRICLRPHLGSNDLMLA